MSATVDGQTPDAPVDEASAPLSREVLDWSSEDVRTDELVAPMSTGLAYTGDKHFFRMVVIFSGTTLLVAVAGMIGLAAFEKDIPEGIVAAASGLIGLMTGTFAARNGK